VPDRNSREKAVYLLVDTLKKTEARKEQITTSTLLPINAFNRFEIKHSFARLAIIHIQQTSYPTFPHESRLGK
jgi:hypothetical protein